MANEIQFQTSPVTPDATLYFVVRQSSGGSVWQTTTETFVTFVDANIGDYDVAMSEQGTSSGYYVGSFPTAITTAGSYTVVIYEQAGGSPSVAADTPVGIIESFNWTGAAESEDDSSGDDLISLSYYKTYHGITSTDATRDAALEAQISAASKAIVSYCRKGIKAASYTDYYDPQTTSYRLSLRQYPVIALSSITLRPYDSDAETVSGSDYMVDTEAGIIQLKSTATSTDYFSAGFRTVKAVYTAGYSSVPADLKGYCAELVKWKYDRGRKDQTVESESLGDWSYTNAKGSDGAGGSSSWPASIRQGLDRYRAYNV